MREILKLIIFSFRRIEWKNFEAIVTEQKHIKVRDVILDAKENLGELLQVGAKRTASIVSGLSGVFGNLRTLSTTE